MREPVRDKERIQHILDAIETIESGRLKYSTSESASDPIIYYGFVKHVEIIGEAVYMLSKEFKAAHPEIEWAAHMWVEISSKASSGVFPFLRSASSIAMVGSMLQKWP